jgi:hypothetical protein
MIVLVLALASIANLAQTTPPSVAGSWLLKMETPQGTRSVELELQQEGSKLSGTFADERGSANLKKDYVEGRLSFAVPVQGPDGVMTLVFSGRSGAGGELSGSITAPMGELPWTAERVTKPRAEAKPQTAVAAPKAHEPTLSGTWAMTLPGPQEDNMDALLVLRQEGSKVGGTLTLGPLGEAPLRGEYANGKLSFAVSMQGPSEQIELSFRGAATASGGLSGTMSGPMGDVSWSATRQK